METKERIDRLLEALKDHPIWEEAAEIHENTFGTALQFDKRGWIEGLLDSGYQAGLQRSPRSTTRDFVREVYSALADAVKEVDAKKPPTDEEHLLLPDSNGCRYRITELVISGYLGGVVFIYSRGKQIWEFPIGSTPAIHDLSSTSMRGPITWKGHLVCLLYLKSYEISSMDSTKVAEDNPPATPNTPSRWQRCLDAFGGSHDGSCSSCRDLTCPSNPVTQELKPQKDPFPCPRCHQDIQLFCGSCISGYMDWEEEQEKLVLKVRSPEERRKVRPLSHRGRMLLSGDLFGPIIDPRRF